MTGPRIDPWDRRYLADALARSVAAEGTAVKGPARGPAMGATPRYRLPRTDGTSRDEYTGQSLVNALSDYVPVVGDVKAAARGGEMASEGHPISGLATALAGVLLPAAVGKGRRLLGGVLDGAESAVAREAANPYAHLPEPPRVYHGTSAAFNEFDPQRLDPHALYGPGYYHTENPDIAAGYTQREVGTGVVPESERPEVARLLREATEHAQTLRGISYVPPMTVEEAEAEIADFMATGRDDAIIGVHGRNVFDRATSDRISEILKASRNTAPNIRPARVALERPFDIDKTYTSDDIRNLAERTTDATHAATLRGLADYVAKNNRRTFTGEHLYDALQMGGLSKPEINETLRSAGFDGITHMGGARTGNEPHHVAIAFDRSQIRSPWGDWKDATQFGDSVAVRAGTALGAALSKRRN